MELKILHDDPLGILVSTKPVIEGAEFVSINESGFEDLAQQVIQKFGDGLNREELSFGSVGDFEKDVQLTFIEDVVNFCFWAGKGQPKWEVVWPEGSVTKGGWHGLAACFKRGLAEEVPILDAGYLSEMTLEDARKFFRGKDGVEIPLLHERLDNLREAGKVLQEKFGGRFSNVLAASDYDSIKIVNALLDHFPSFRDVSIVNGQEVRFLKRAQICPNDLAYIVKDTAREMKNLDQLTAYADYKLPQVLRMFGILNYEKSLAEKIDNFVEISHDRAEEIEIRAATVWSVELLRQRIGRLSAGQIDNTLWLISQGVQNDTKPYHRTRTIFY